MAQQLIASIAAGAAGTAALNLATYGDMAIRGRPASDVPGKLAGILAEKMGIDLSGTGKDAKKIETNRQEGLGALLGYVTGIGVGIAYGYYRSSVDTVSLPIAGLGVGGLAMAASDVPAAVFGATDPASWSSTEWASDFGFHLLYGLVTVLTYEALTEE